MVLVFIHSQFFNACTYWLYHNSWEWIILNSFPHTLPLPPSPRSVLLHLVSALSHAAERNGEQRKKKCPGKIVLCSTSALFTVDFFPLLRNTSPPCSICFYAFRSARLCSFRSVPLTTLWSWWCNFWETPILKAMLEKLWIYAFHFHTLFLSLPLPHYSEGKAEMEIYTFHFCTLFPKDASAGWGVWHCQTETINRLVERLHVRVVDRFFQVDSQ